MRAAADAPEGRPNGVALLSAVAAGFAVAISAPFMGEIRQYIRDAFPGHFVAVVGTAITIAATVAVGWALTRIRERRARRYALVAAAVTLAVGYSYWAALGIPDSDAVERVHFIEYGLVTWLFYRAWHPIGDASSLWLTVLSATTVGTVEEWTQWLIPSRVGEIRDIFLNLAAIVCGLLFCLAVWPPKQVSRPGRTGLAWTALVGALAVGAIATFLDSAHLGHEIHDPAIGVFRSIYRADELRAAARERQRQWADNPPVARPRRLSREDQYASEGLLHVQERNTRWTAGDVRAAWGENQILEAYFAPTLDAPSYVSATGHRWTSEQRADAERRTTASGHTASPYVSQALRSFPIVLWPHAPFRLLSAAVVGVLLAFAAMMRRRARTP